MEYKFYLAIALALIGSVLGEDALLSYDAIKGTSAMHNVLVDKEMWEMLKLPTDVTSTAGDFARGLAVYASTLFDSEEGSAADYEAMFEKQVVEPCKEVVEKAGENTDEEKGELLVATEKDCAKIVAEPKRWMELSLKVAEKNYLL